MIALLIRLWAIKKLWDVVRGSNRRRTVPTTGSR